MEYCPTKNMIADFFSKPTQGSLFREQRSTILNLESDDIAAYGPHGFQPSRSQECVGTEEKNSKRDKNDNMDQNTTSGEMPTNSSEAGEYDIAVGGSQNMQVYGYHEDGSSNKSYTYADVVQIKV